MASNATNISNTCSSNASCTQQIADAEGCTYNIADCELPVYINCGYDPVCAQVAWIYYCSAGLNSTVQTDLQAYNGGIIDCNALVSQ